MQEWDVSSGYQELAAVEKQSEQRSRLPLVNGDKSARLGELQNWRLRRVCSGRRTGSVSWRQRLLVA